MIEKITIFLILCILGISIYISFFAKCEQIGFLPITSIPAKCLTPARRGRRKCNCIWTIKQTQRTTNGR